MIFLSSRKGNGKQGAPAQIINDSFFKGPQGTLDHADFVSFDNDKEEFSQTMEGGGTLGPDDPDDNPGNTQDGGGVNGSS